MNAAEILHNGHLTVLNATQGLSEPVWETPGVCGVWSAKEIVIHLTSFEQVLVEVLTGFLRDAPTPTRDRLIADMDAFNEVEVAKRREMVAADVMAEYEHVYSQAASLLQHIPLEMCWQNGTLPWYGEQYDLDDFIVYAFYGHKQEHCAQIAAFRNRLAHTANTFSPDDNIAAKR